MFNQPGPLGTLRDCTINKKDKHAGTRLSCAHACAHSHTHTYTLTHTSICADMQLSLHVVLKQLDQWLSLNLLPTCGICSHIGDLKFSGLSGGST